MRKKEIFVGGGAVAALIWDLAVNTELIRSHLPKGLAMDSQPWIIALLAALVLLLVFSHGEKERSSETPPQNTNENRATGGAATANPVMDASNKLELHQHFADKEIRKPVQPPEPIKKRTLHVSAKKGRIVWLNEGQMGGGIFFEPEEKDSLSVKGIVVDFRNEPNSDFSVLTWHNVKASVFYYDERGSEVAEVGSSHWLEHASIKNDLPRHETRRLVIGLRAKDAWVAFNDGDARKIPTSIRSAKIVLHDDREFELSFSLKMDLDSADAGSVDAIKLL